MDGHRTSGCQHGGTLLLLLLSGVGTWVGVVVLSWVVGLDSWLGLGGGRCSGDWLPVGLVVLVVKVLDWVGSVAGVRVVLLDARIEEVEGATVVSCWCSVDEEAQPMVGAGFFCC